MDSEKQFRAFAQCKCCRHEHVDAVNYGLATGVPAVVLARRYSLPTSSLSRHKRGHLPPALVQRLRAQALAGDMKAEADVLRDTENIGLLAKVTALRERADAIYDAAIGSGDYKSAVAALRALHVNLELTGKLVGQLNTGSVTVNTTLVATPSYIQLRTKLLAVLRRHPAALREVIQAFSEAETVPAEALPQIEEHRVESA